MSATSATRMQNFPVTCCSSVSLTFMAAPPPYAASYPKWVDLIWNRKINPGRVFDLAVPLDQVAEGYSAMDERRAIKTLLTMN